MAGLIAIIEDEPELQALYRLALASRGHSIAFVSADADEAVDMYASREKKPDLVIIDRRLNGSSGIDAAFRIAGMDPGARILFATADADLCFAAGVPGVAGVLQKPFLMGDLLAAIESALARDGAIRYPRRRTSTLV